MAAAPLLVPLFRLMVPEDAWLAVSVRPLATVEDTPVAPARAPLDRVAVPSVMEPPVTAPLAVTLVRPVSVAFRSTALPLAVVLVPSTSSARPLFCTHVMAVVPTVMASVVVHRNVAPLNVPLSTSVVAWLN